MRYKKHLFIPTFHTFVRNLSGKTVEALEVDNNPSTAFDSVKVLAQNAQFKRKMWGVLIFLLYLILSYMLFAFSIGFNLTGSYLGPYSHDQLSYIWELYWWPFAIGHHINPFISTYIWHPYGMDLTIPATVPGASLLALPITLIFGPVASYNVLIIVGNALSAFCTFLLVKHLTKSYTAGIIAGFLFGFSTYQFVQVVHLNLALTFFIPLMVYLFLLLWEKKLHGIVFILLVGLCLAFQYLIAIEIFLTFSLFVGIAYIFFVLVYPEHFKKLVKFTMYLVAAYAFCMILLAPFIYTALTHRIPTSQLNPVVAYSIDPLNFVIPTKSTYFGANVFAPLSSTFKGNMYENSGYLGIPAFVILIIYTVKYWNERLTRLLFFLLASFMVLSLGPGLHIAGYSLLTLPAHLLEIVPVINQVLPERLTVYVFFVASLMIGIWAGKELTGLRLANINLTLCCKYILIALTIIALFPNVRGGTIHTKITIPSFFTSGVYKDYIQRGDNVLYFPYASDGDSMLYQEYTNMYFNLAEGYVGPWGITPKEFLANPMATKMHIMYKRAIKSSDFNDFKSYLHDFKVNEIILPQWEYQKVEPILSRLGITPITIQGILVYKIAT